jgi:hypothetical protein
MERKISVAGKTRFFKTIIYICYKQQHRWKSYPRCPLIIKLDMLIKTTNTMKNKQVSSERSPREVIKYGVPMGSKYKLLFLSLLIFAFACNRTDQEGTKVIENDHIRLVFVTKPVPFLKELVQKPTQKNLLGEPADQNLFTIDLLKPGGGNITIESRSAKRGSVKVVRNNEYQRIELQFSGLGPVNDMKVNITGVLDENSPIVRWSIKIDNPSLQKLGTVRFPYVAVVPAIGSPDDDFIVAPSYPGTMIENPAKNWPANYSLECPFPGGQSAQFFSYQDHDAGVYIGSMDTVGYNRNLRISKKGNNPFTLMQEYKMSENITAHWESPYEVVLGITSGSWQQTADIYKLWAVKQSWCAKTLSQRDDIPAFWKQGPCIHTCEVRNYDEKSRLCNGSYYPKLTEHLKMLREKIDGPIVPMLAGWENYRRWTAGAYFPIFDEEHAKGVLNQLRKDSFHPFVFLSGLYYTFRNEGRDSSAVPGSDSFKGSFVIDRESGKPKTAILNESSANNIWKRHSYEFCPAAPGTKEFFRTVIDNAHALGIDIIQMDQTTSGAGDICYSTEHGHQPGRGAYQSQAFHLLLDDMRKHGKSLSPDFLLMHEEVHEELIPFLDGFHTREFTERWWYRSAPGARGIPLFSYLYHEYAIAYGGEGVSVSKDKNPKLVRDHAINMVTGKTPGISVWGNQKAIYEVHSDQIKMLRNHSHLLKTEAQQFLMLGRMLHSLEFEVPTIILQIASRGSGKPQVGPFEQKAVLTSSWQSSEGLVGHCLVNITDEKQKVNLQLDTRNAPGWPKSDIDLYHADKPETCEHVLKGVSLPHEFVLELAPLEAVFFVMRPAR